MLYIIRKFFDNTTSGSFVYQGTEMQENLNMGRTGIFILWIGLLGLISCSKDVEKVGDMTMGQDEVVVRLVVSRPFSGGNTKAAGDAETEINEIQLLVFEEGVYKYRVPGISITNTGTTTTFNAHLLSSDKRLDLYIIANATASVIANEPNVNDTEDNVRMKLQMAFSAVGTLPALPMFGHHTLPSGLNGDQVKNINGIKMLRAVARVDVLVGSVPEFELVSIQAYRANERIQVIPDQDTLTVTIPSVPQNSQMNVNTNAVAISGNQLVGGFYLPESFSPAESARVTGATCVVIGGKYGYSQETTYYRIDFDPNNTSASFGQVLRNHRYVFTIQGVAGPGWKTPDDAANNRSAQINLEIQAWDEATTDMYFDTEHHFGVSSREMILKNRQNALDTIWINTDIPDYTLQWSDEQGHVSGIAGENLTDAYFKVEKINQGSGLVVTALQHNSGTERVEYFVITANRWKIGITVRQLTAMTSTKVVTLLSFGNRLGHFGVNIFSPRVAAEVRGRGTRGILDNVANFGPSGTVVCGGINLLETDAATNTLSETGLAVADIVYCNYIANSTLSSQDISSIRKWLEANTKRVLIISYDWTDVNVPILTEFLKDIKNANWSLSFTGAFPLVGKSVTNFFTDAGPFTSSPYTPVAAGFTFQNYDAYHGEINAVSEPDITPILNGAGGGIVLGVDAVHRIIYMGDIDLNTASNGVGATTSNHINNTQGTINNDAVKLIANVFAWAVGIVTGE